MSEVIDMCRAIQNNTLHFTLNPQNCWESFNADFYDIVGVTSEFTDNKYGWTSIRKAGIKPVREGFLIVLPRTRVLDD